MPQTQSKEKIVLLDLYGADVRLVPAANYDDPKHYSKTAKRIAEELNAEQANSAVWAAQFENLANRDIHYRTTGQEIWQQTEGKIDGFACAVGTGGTLAGVSKALKEHNSAIKIAIADPMDSGLYHHYKHGELKSEGRSIMEGIGINFITPNLADAEVDEVFQISDETALPYIFNMLKHEGLSLGGSSGINIAGAVELAKQLGPGHNIVTILCDGGSRYQSKLFNPAFLERMSLPVPSWLN